MDPWSGSDEITVTTLQVFDNSTKFLSFEDNFIDSLPDSKEYIALLESKLQKLKSNSSVIKQLQEKREACMRELLCGMTSCAIEEENFLEEQLQSTSILRTIAPEKQALVKGEIVEFIKYDQLKEDVYESDGSVEEKDNSSTENQQN